MTPHRNAMEELQAHDYRRLHSADRLGALLTTGPKWIALAVLVWQAGLSIQVLAAPGGAASLLQRFDRQTTAWELICWAAGLAGVVYGLYSRLVLARERGRPELRRAPIVPEREPGGRRAS